MTPSLKEIAARTQDIYERNAARFDRERPKVLFEKVWLDRLLELVPDNGSILDVGCGAAEPIAAYFIDQGRLVTGVDASAAMLEISRTRYPDLHWWHQDMRTLTIDQTFDGVVAWNSFFHLTQDEQRAVLPALADRVSPGGALMVTVGDKDGEVTGRVGDDTVYHSSLDAEEYRSILNSLGFEIVKFVIEDLDCDYHSVLLAKRST
jgi:SAM-dependent methyltransferase